MLGVGDAVEPGEVAAFGFGDAVPGAPLEPGLLEPGVAVEGEEGLAGPGAEVWAIVQAAHSKIAATKPILIPKTFVFIKLEPPQV